MKKLNEKVYKANLSDLEHMKIRRASMRGDFDHKFTRTGNTTSFHTSNPNKLASDLEKVVDAGETSWKEIFDLREEWIRGVRKWTKSVKDMHGNEVDFKNDNNQGGTNVRNIVAVLRNKNKDIAGVYQRHNDMGMVQFPKKINEATKVPPLLLKRNIKDQKAWFSKNWKKGEPLPTEFKHLEASATKAKKAQVIDKEIKAAREKLSNKAYGATKGTKFGGDDNIAGTAISDLMNKAKQAGDVKQIYSRGDDVQVPNVKDDEDTKPKRVSTGSSSDKKVDRLALIKAAQAKVKAKAASRFDIPTLNPDDEDYDDASDVPFTKATRAIDEEIGSVINSIRSRINGNKQIAKKNPASAQKNPNPTAKAAGKLNVRSRPIQRVIGEAFGQIIGEDSSPELGTVKAHAIPGTDKKPHGVIVKVFKHDSIRGDNYWVTHHVKTYKKKEDAKKYIDRINKTVSESLSEEMGHRKFRNEVRKTHGKDVKFWKDNVSKRLVALRNDPYDRKRIVGTYSHGAKSGAIFREAFLGRTKPMASKTVSKGRTILNAAGKVAKGTALAMVAAGAMHHMNAGNNTAPTPESKRTPEQVQQMNAKLEKKLPQADINGKKHYILKNPQAKEFVPPKTKIVVHDGKVYHTWSAGKYNYAFQHQGKTTKV